MILRYTFYIVAVFTSAELAYSSIIFADGNRSIYFFVLIWLANIPIWATYVRLIPKGRDPKIHRIVLILMAVQSLVTLVGIELGLHFEAENFANQFMEMVAVLRFFYVYGQFILWLAFVWFAFGIAGGDRRMTVKGFLMTVGYLAVLLATIFVPLAWVVHDRAGR